MTEQSVNDKYTHKLEALFEKFWVNTTFFEVAGGNMAMSYEDFQELNDLCVKIEHNT